ncbi:GNAT family N-acetyltransferase [Candidatus Colwellia aromaticivorans]|uniref:GNAT family N-acetyltransferase n=1 Tax=Candidatus Colwellia aromaticivorans TaxID=2267621 RepID=UPI000DF19EC1|nr:GNAT family N-acetyltransferase [Candidatus Colwellia aromaticivorans]
MSYSVSRVQWKQAAPLLKDIREKVFICERRIPRKVEFDCNDNSAFHMLVCDDNSHEPIATGRISSTGEISRIAVVMEFRRASIDKVIIQGLFRIAQELLLNEVYIDSPLENVSYFSQHHFHPVGVVFMEAGMPKQRMVCAIKTALADADQAKYYLNH